MCSGNEIMMVDGCRGTIDPPSFDCKDADCNAKCNTVACEWAVFLGGFLAWVELSPILRLGSFPLGCCLVGGEWGRVWLWRSRSKLVLGGSKLGSV
ncbi:hypothetical protein ACOSQ2_022532 [Xanthoceras sorbifolium]